MSNIIFAPKGASVGQRQGTITIQAPGATGFWGTDNYKLDTYPNAFSGIDTGAYNSRMSGRFDDPTYYTA